MLKTAELKLRNALITNYNKELVKYISECVLNVLNGNTKLSGFNTCKLKTTRPRFARSSIGSIIPGQESAQSRERVICFAPTWRHYSNDGQLNF